MFDQHERRRGHRVAGPVPQHQEERHWILAAIGVAVAVIGAGVSAYAASEQAAAQRREAKIQDKILKQQAQSERDQAEYEERQARRKNRYLLGKQLAELSDLGLDPSSGSPLLLAMDSAKQAELDAINIRNIGARAAGSSELEAAEARRRGEIARRGGQLGVAASTVGGAQSVLRNFVSYRGSSASPGTGQTGQVVTTGYVG